MPEDTTDSSPYHTILDEDPVWGLQKESDPNMFRVSFELTGVGGPTHHTISCRGPGRYVQALALVKSALTPGN